MIIIVIVIITMIIIILIVIMLIIIIIMIIYNNNSKNDNNDENDYDNDNNDNYTLQPLQESVSGFCIGGARLGTQLTSTVTIVKSDYPNGKFSFMGETQLSIENPAQQRQLTFKIMRTEGLLGEQLVSMLLFSTSSLS